ncbi:MAG: YCF48-related protein, partial [Pseudomonadales bacterium]
MNKRTPVRLLQCTALLLSIGVFAAQAATDYYALPALPDKNPSLAQLVAITAAGKRLVAVGERGIIIYSDDDGKQWQQASVPVSHALTAVSFANEERGWAVGHSGVILHSSNGGETWKVQFDGSDANKAWLKFMNKRVAMLQEQVDAAKPATDAQQAVAIDPEQPDLALQLEDAQYAVEDAEEAVKTGPNDPFLDVWFSDEKNGFAVGAYGMLYRTSDGGLKWRLQADKIENVDRYHYYSLAASDDGTLYLSGETGILFRSKNGGDKWEALPTPYDGSLFGTMVAADQSVLTFGLRGNIFRSEDQGDSWHRVASDSSASLYGGSRLANDHIMLTGSGGAILESRDNGQTFKAETHSSRSTFAGVLANDANDLLIVGRKGLVVMDAATGEKEWSKKKTRLQCRKIREYALLLPVRYLPIERCFCCCLLSPPAGLPIRPRNCGPTLASKKCCRCRIRISSITS